MASDNLRGILLMLASMALFGMEDLFLKLAAENLPVGQVVFISGFFGFPIFAAMVARQGQAVFTRAALHPAVIARNLGEMVGTLGYITALATVPLATVSAVLQALPLAVTLAAALFLKESVGWRRWSAIAAGFIGVLTVIRPGMDGFRPETMWVLLAVAGLVVRDLSSRLIPKESSTAQVSAWGLLAVVALGAMMMVQGGAVMPSGGQSMVLLGAVIFGTAGYWAVVAASRTGEVSVVAPFRYARLIFAILIGTLYFHEGLDRLTIAGSVLIIASGLYAFARERRRKRALPPTSAPFP